MNKYATIPSEHQYREECYWCLRDLISVRSKKIFMTKEIKCLEEQYEYLNSEDKKKKSYFVMLHGELYSRDMIHRLSSIIKVAKDIRKSLNN